MKNKLDVTKNQLKKAIAYVEENGYLRNADFHGCKVTNVKIKTVKSSGVCHDIDIDGMKDTDKVVLFTGKLMFEGKSEVYDDCFYSLKFLLDIIKNKGIK